MRRAQFVTTIVVAALTFFALQAFVGHRYWRPYGWRGGYGRYYYHSRDCDGYYRDDPNRERSNQPAAPTQTPGGDSLR